MSDTVTAISLSAAFVAGLSGSVHCFAMCGGLASALSMRTRSLSRSPRQSFALACLTQSGRIVSYAMVGALAGAAGSFLSTLMDWVHVAQWLRVFAGILLVAMALRIALRWNAFAWLERAGGLLWSRYLSKFMSARTTTQRGVGQSILLGMAWGWLPCGLVYSMALFAAFAGNALQGAMVMLAFGAGTLPSMLSSALLAGQLARALNHPRLRWLAAALLAVFGAWTMVAAFQHRGHH